MVVAVWSGTVARDLSEIRAARPRPVLSGWPVRRLCKIPAQPVPGASFVYVISWRGYASSHVRSPGKYRRPGAGTRPGGRWRAADVGSEVHHRRGPRPTGGAEDLLSGQ